MISMLQKIFNYYLDWRKLCSENRFDEASDIIAACAQYVKYAKDDGQNFNAFLGIVFKNEGSFPKSDNFQRRIYEMFHGWDNVDVVIFSGKQGSGKTTSQNALRDLLLAESKLKKNYDQVQAMNFEADQVAEINYADPIHEINDYVLKMLKDKYGVNHNFVKNRKLMQLIGSDFGRDELGKYVWIDIAKNRINALNCVTPEPGKKHIVLIGDCRFENEFDSFPDAYRVRLHAPEEIRKIRAAKWGNTKHRSEIGLDRYANAGVFDDYIDTAEFDAVKGPQHVTTLVMSRLQRGGWVERRGRVTNIPTYQEEIYTDVEYP